MKGPGVSVVEVGHGSARVLRGGLTEKLTSSKASKELSSEPRGHQGRSPGQGQKDQQGTGLRRKRLSVVMEPERSHSHLWA